MSKVLSVCCLWLFVFALVALALCFSTTLIYLVWNFLICRAFEGVHRLSFFQAFVVNLVIAFVGNCLSTSRKGRTGD